MPGNATRPLAVRFWAKVRKTATCWLWLGKPSRFGYGRITLTGKDTVGAHVASWFLATGTLPIKGVVVRHTCDVPGCVRPGHLKLGTQADNLRDMWVRGRARPRGDAPPQPRDPVTGRFLV